MITFEGIRENLKFIAIETERQVTSTLEMVRSPDKALYDKIVTRDDYIDNLKNIIENQCYQKMGNEKHMPKQSVDEIRAIHIIAVNLERIADNCVNIIQQLGYLDDPAYLHNYDYRQPFQDLLESLGAINIVLAERDLAGALRICKTEDELDRMYKVNFDLIMERLEGGRNVRNLITTLFIFRYLERMGDSLLNVGEALIFAIIGEKIKIHQFQSLRQSLRDTGFDGSISDIDFQSFWGTRSGCRISRVEQKAEVDTRAMESIFKEGSPPKIKAEKDNLELWGTLFPGLTANVLNFNEGPESSSMLVQFLPGCTLDEVILNATPEYAVEVLAVLKETVEQVWERSLKTGPAPVDYIAQLRERLGEIRRVHPHFSRQGQKVGLAPVESSDELIDLCEGFEKSLVAPFTVITHGDFNTNNVIFNNYEKAIYFIDLYRSRRGDYVQDVSVFLASNFRVPVFDDELRGRLNAVIADFYDFARGFAKRNGDAEFEARMALALARSFYTSTRFEFHAKFAHEMFLRAHYLLDKAARHCAAEKPWSDFKLNPAILNY